MQSIFSDPGRGVEEEPDMNDTTDPGWNIPSALVEKEIEIDALKKEIAYLRSHLDFMKSWDEMRDRDFTQLYEDFLQLEGQMKAPITPDNFADVARSSLELHAMLNRYKDKGNSQARHTEPAQPARSQQPVRRFNGGRQLFADS